MKTSEAVTAYAAVIRRCPLFADLDGEALDSALQTLNASFLSYEKNAVLHFAGDRMERFGLVLFGRIKVLLDDIEGNTTIMAEVSPGQTFGESLCLLSRDNPDLYITAAEPSGVLWLSADRLFAGIHSAAVETLERRFSRMLADRALSMNNRIQILSKLTLREKIVTYFTFVLQSVGDNRVDVSLSREEMALYLGTNRSALSRELSKMQRDGLLTFQKNHFTVHF